MMRTSLDWSARHGARAFALLPGISMDLHSLQAALARLAAARGDPRFDHPRNLALALAAECGAVLDRFKWLSDEDALALDADIREGVARDAVEAMLYALRLAASMGVDVAAALAERVAHAGPTEQAGGAAGGAEEAGGAVAASADEDAAATHGDGEGFLHGGAGEGEAVLQGTATRFEGGEPAAIVHPAPPGRASTGGTGNHSRQVESRSGSGPVACMPAVNAGPSAPALPVAEAATARIAPPPAASGMVDAANAAFARAQAAAGRVQRVFPAPAPAPAPAVEPPEEDEFDSTVTLDAGPTPVTRSVPPSLAAGSSPAPVSEAACGSTVPADDGEPPAQGGASRDATVRRVDPMLPTPAQDHEASDAGFAGSATADAGERTGDHGGKRAAGHGRAHDKSSGGTGHGARHPAHEHQRTGRGHGAQRDGDGRDRRPRDEHADPRRGPTEPRNGTAARRAAETRGHAQERHTGQGRHAERGPAPRAEAHGDRYAKLDLEAVQAMRKSLARHLESLHRKDPLLRELGEELETLRRTLYSNAVKPAWIADTLLTLRRMLEQSIGEGLGAVLDAERRIAAIDALLG